jgi:hypothetical protein
MTPHLRVPRTESPLDQPGLESVSPSNVSGLLSWFPVLSGLAAGMRLAALTGGSAALTASLVVGILFLAIAIFTGVWLWQRGQCAGADVETRALDVLVARESWEDAVRQTDAILARYGKNLCSASRQLTTRSGYDGRIGAIFREPHRPGNIEGHYDSIRKMQAAQIYAAEHGLPEAKRPAAMALVGKAANHGYWMLAREAWLTAWRNGTISHRDTDSVIQYYGLVYNLGDEMATISSEVYRPDGLSLIRTADELSKAFRLAGKGEAHHRLSEMISANEAQWPPPAPDPLLWAKGQFELPPAPSSRLPSDTHAGLWALDAPGAADPSGTTRRE